MKFKADVNTLREVCGPVEGAAAPASPISDYSHIAVIVEDEGTLTLVGQNDRFQAKVTGIAVESPEPGRILFPAAQWRQLVRQAAGSSIELESDGISYAHVVAATAEHKRKCNVNILPGDDFVGLELNDEVLAFALDRHALLEAIAVVRPSIDTDNHFEVVNGLCIEVDASAVRLVGTDTHVLGYAELPPVYDQIGEIPLSAAPSGTMIRVIPRGVLGLLEKMLSSTQGDFVIRFGGSLVRFDAGGLSLTSRLLADGTAYVNWQRAIPDAIDGPGFTTSVGAIANASAWAEIVTGGEAAILDVTINANGVSITAAGGNGSTEEDAIPAESFVGDTTLRLDSRLVRSALQGIPTTSKLDVWMVSNGHRVQIFPAMPNLATPCFQVWGVKTKKRED